VPVSHWPTGRPVATAHWLAGRYGPGSPPPWLSWRPTGASCARQGQPACGSWPPLLPLRPPRGSRRRPLPPPLRCSRTREKRSCLQYTQMVSEPVFRIRIHLIRIRIQHYRLNNNPYTDPHPICTQGFHDQKMLQKFTDNKFLVIFLYIKNYNLGYLSLGLHKGRTSYRSLQPSKENILNFFLLLWVILPSWIRIQIPNPNTDPLA
jgi:hypothetical protein